MSKKLAVQCQCKKRALEDLSKESFEFADTIVDVERIFLSECDLVKKHLLSSRKLVSEPNIQYTVDYDDLCKPWPSSEHPAFKQYDDVALKPMLCTWKFITRQDIECIKQHLFDQNAIKFIIEQKLPDTLLFKNQSKEVFLEYAWVIFEFARDNGFSGKGISSILGILYLTHRFFLSDFWRTAREVYAFFADSIYLHGFLKPPESDMVFTFSESNKLLDMFRSSYMQKLELLRSACIPSHNLILKISKCNTTHPLNH
ncbi:hypothetical protein TSAR_012958 [Trichomalopsis sarcophagae]|uniref:Uncharacterized protein n=1 Tax=Trichomalopsis sarcophagae TaxID=543379 RepID=A0A232FD68_9HYME|nr:hypothetical protein TSAR_012958 [Trichomalopsis sarcophagae]